MQDLPAAQTPELGTNDDTSGGAREPVPMETNEEAAENEQEQEEIRGRGQTRRGLDN